MRLSHTRPKEVSRVRARFVCVAAMVCGLALLVAASSALASYEQVATFAGTPGVFAPAGFFAGWPEQVQLGGVGGMAVNYTGAGGVPAGTIYAASDSLNSGLQVARYNPNGSFSEAWSWTANVAPFRCGPDGALSQPTCQSTRGTLPQYVDVDVDQSTGYVYAISAPSTAGEKLVHVYSADGSRVVAEFGEKAASSESIAESPEKLHELHSTGSIAVNSVGDVYISDTWWNGSGYEKRIMEFEPQAPGDFEHYVYAGQAHDFAVGQEGARPVADAAGHVYTAFEGGIEEYDPSSPGAPPICKFTLALGGIQSLTVNPQSGEVFFYDSNDQLIHRLLACSEGKFVEADTIKLSPAPKGENIGGLAFDPVKQFAPGRSPGVLYAGDAQGAKSKGQAGTGTYEVESSLGYVFSRPVESPPVVEGESVAHVTAGSAVLGAELDPEGTLTRYVFQYETQTAFEGNGEAEPFAGASELPLGGGVAGYTASNVAVSAALSGLGADTQYRYRVVARSNCYLQEPERVCEASGEPASFHTYQSTVAGVLPDDRVYELVSPPQKNGGEVFPAEPDVGSCGGGCKPGVLGAHFAQVSAPDGEAVAYRGGPFSGREGGVGVDEYVARRNTTLGWQTSNVTPIRLENVNVSGYKAFNADLSRGVIAQETSDGGVALGGGAPAGYSNLYTQPTGDPESLTPFMAFVPPDRSGTEFLVKFAGASADLSRVFFEANDALTEEVPGVAPASVDGGSNKNNLYEWSGGRISLVNVLPGNAVTQPGASFGTPDAHVVSNDGTRVFWSDAAGRLYVRIGGKETVQVSASHRAAPDPLGVQPATFLGASTDGASALFSSSEELTDDANTGLGQEIVLKATEGTFKLSFGGQTTGAVGTGTTEAGSNQITALASGAGVFVVGEAISGPGIPTGATITAATASTLTLSDSATADGTGVALASDLPWNSTNSVVQGALQALSTVGQGNVTVSAGKQGPAVTFVGALASSQEAIGVDGSGLTGTVSLVAFRPGRDLYEWHEGVLIDLTAGQGSYALRGLVGQSDDLSHVYFVDTQVLTGKEENENCTNVAGKKTCEVASEGANNLYLWTRSTGTRYIASLSKEDEHAVGVEVADWSPLPALRTAQASPNGRFLTFMSVAPLTGYENTGPCELVNNGSAVATYRNALCPEVFLYDSATGKLRCPSCNRSGASPLGWSVLRRINGSANLPLAHYLTDEGRLFFDSRDSLVAADTNAGVEDVYEYEPEGVGDCETGGGCVSLISAGTGVQDSNFLAADEDGSNVFFTTYDELSPRDMDGTIDLYDARVGGGLAIEAAVLPSECHGETCQPPVAVPALTAPASLSFEGSGNAKQATGVNAPKKKVVHKKPKRKPKNHKNKHGKRKAARRASSKRARHIKRNRGGSK